MNNGKTVGYVRVSSVGQNLDRQMEAIGSTDELFQEKESAKDIRNRPVFKECLKFLRKDDTLIVSSIDRAARSLQDLLNIVDSLMKKGVTVRFIGEDLTFKPNGKNTTSKLMLQLLGAIAEFERSLIKERQAAGIKAAMKRGVQFGRKHKLSEKQCKEILDRSNSGESKTALAKEYGIGRQAVYAAIARAESAKELLVQT